MVALGVSDSTTPKEAEVVVAQSSGGIGEDAGTSYVRREHGWVKATKLIKKKVSGQYEGSLSSHAVVEAYSAVVRRLKNFDGDVAVAASVNACCAKNSRSAPESFCISHSYALSNVGQIIVKGYNCTYEALDFDVLLALLDDE